MADGQEGAAVRPAERKHTEAVGEILFGMVVKARKEFDLLGTGTVVDGVIEDEDVDTICARQGCNGGLDDGCSEQCGEPAPMDVAGVHEAVEGILGKGEGSALEVNLHEERAMCEDRREGNEEEAEDRKATMFVGIRRAQNTADVVTSEEILHFLGQLIFRAVGLCYTVHGMSLHWMFLLVLKLYQMDVAHAILLCRKAYFSSLTAYYLSAKFE